MNLRAVHSSWKLIVPILILCLAVPRASALDNLLPATQVEKLIADTTNRYKTIQTLTASFVQVRSTRLLKKPAVTKGKFYYRKPAQFLWKFTAPYTISILSDGKHLYKIDTGHRTYSKLRIKKYQSTIMNFMDVSKSFEFLNKYFYIKQFDNGFNSRGA